MKLTKTLHWKKSIPAIRDENHTWLICCERLTKWRFYKRNLCTRNGRNAYCTKQLDSLLDNIKSKPLIILQRIWKNLTSRVFGWRRCIKRKMVNLDTIAYEDSNGPRYVVIGRVSSINAISVALADAVTEYTSLIPYYASGYASSDHKVFEAIGIDSIQLIEFDFDDYADFPDPGVNPHYHTDGDSIDSPNTAPAWSR